MRTERDVNVKKRRRAVSSAILILLLDFIQTKLLTKHTFIILSKTVFFLLHMNNSVI